MNNLEYLAGLSGFEIPSQECIYNGDEVKSNVLKEVSLPDILSKCNHTQYCIMKGCNGYRDCTQIKKFYDKYGPNYINTKQEDRF
jgi:hypothetical protein